MKIVKSLSVPFRRFLRDEKAATAIEYALIAGGIAVAVAATVMVLGTKVSGVFESIKSAWPS
jgi:pilus assembly protein Flp/PilA